MATTTEYISFLQQRIAKLEFENEQMAEKKAMYIFTWDVTVPTPRKHHVKQTSRDGKEIYVTVSNRDGNKMTGTVKTYPMFELDHGKMQAGMGITKGEPGYCISLHFYLKTVKRARVHLKYTLCYDGKVIWSKEKREILEVQKNRPSYAGNIREVLRSRLPSSDLLELVIEVIEWEIYKH
jgi:hypothetical protein